MPSVTVMPAVFCGDQLPHSVPPMAPSALSTFVSTIGICTLGPASKLISPLAGTKHLHGSDECLWSPEKEGRARTRDYKLVFPALCVFVLFQTGPHFTAQVGLELTK